MEGTSIRIQPDRPVEITWPDGSTLRLRWDGPENGVKVSAEECQFKGRTVAASSLIVLPRAANSVLLRISAK